MVLGLENKDGLMIRFKGDGRSYNLGVRMDGSSVSYRTEFETDGDAKGWQVAKVPFEAWARVGVGCVCQRIAIP